MSEPPHARRSSIETTENGPEKKVGSSQASVESPRLSRLRSMMRVESKDQYLQDREILSQDFRPKLALFCRSWLSSLPEGTGRILWFNSGFFGPLFEQENFVDCSLPAFEDFEFFTGAVFVFLHERPEWIEKLRTHAEEILLDIDRNVLGLPGEKVAKIEDPDGKVAKATLFLAEHPKAWVMIIADYFIVVPDTVFHDPPLQFSVWKDFFYVFCIREHTEVLTSFLDPPLFFGFSLDGCNSLPSPLGFEQPKKAEFDVLRGHVATLCRKYWPAQRSKIDVSLSKRKDFSWMIPGAKNDIVNFAKLLYLNIDDVTKKNFSPQQELLKGFCIGQMSSDPATAGVNIGGFSKENDYHVYIAWMFVEESCRGKGTGKTMVESLILGLRTFYGRTRIICTLEYEDDKSRKFWEHLGFGIRKDIIWTSSNTWRKPLMSKIYDPLFK